MLPLCYWIGTQICVKWNLELQNGCWNGMITLNVGTGGRAMEKKAVFWDFDGTLVYANESFFCALKMALEQNKCQVEDGAIKAALEQSLSWHNWEISYERETGAGWWERLFQNLNGFYGQQDADAEKVHRDFRENVLSFGWYTVYADACTVLEYCRQKGYYNYILSNNYPELPLAVEKFGLAEYFSGLVISSHIGYEKPRPEIFRFGLEMAGNPDVCYMIGDNPVADMQGAKALGIESVLVHWDTDPVGYADHICQSLTQIMDFLK